MPARSQSAPFLMFEPAAPVNTPRIWQVGALCRAIADALDARFNPVAVRGEIVGFSRASSGHCYFTLKDETGQVRCAMFRRAALLLDFAPRDGEIVEVRGRLDVYGPRGDLQMIVESLRRAGQGAIFEQFLRLKAKLEAEGLFDAGRKRPLRLMPRGIGVVTSLGAAALHDVATALQRRVPHIPVVVAAASVQGASAPAELRQALLGLYQWAGEPGTPSAKAGATQIDVILLVRGGGSMDDLAAFNDEALARLIAASPVPVISGVGHETDFTIADFVADLRAPTPTAAAELAVQPSQGWLALLENTNERLMSAVLRHLDTRHQRLDAATARLGRPSRLTARGRVALATSGQRLRSSLLHGLARKNDGLQRQAHALPQNLQQGLARCEERLARSAMRLGLLDPKLVLQRGYAWLATADGHAVTGVAQVRSGQALQATLADGTLDLVVARQGNLRF